MLEDYALIGQNRLPDFATTSYGGLLEIVHQANLALDADSRIHVEAMDINHGKSDLAYSLSCFRPLLANSSAIDEFIAEVQCDRPYEQSLNTLRNRLAESPELCAGDGGQDYSQMLLEMIDVDAKSIPLRGTAASSGKGAAEREAIMKDLIDRSLSRAKGKSLIYTGYYHAQKVTCFGTEDEFFGRYLHTKSPYAAGHSYSLTILPARGTMPIGGKPTDFDVKNGPENDLFRVMDEVSEGKVSFMPLTDDLFSEDRIVLNYISKKIAVRPATQFDGFILLPEVEYVPIP
jgi:hypothetical protein